MALWGVGEDVDERSYVQALRAEPPGFAESGKRRAVFNAALQQVDELLTAATAVGPASAPLPLFYAVSQAGRAIAAARLGDNTRWAFAGHGLKFASNAADPGASLVAPQPKGDRDAFGVVAEATGSTPLTAGVQLSELWACLPHLDTAPGLGDGLPRALHVAIRQPYPDAATGELRLDEGLLPQAECEARLAERLAAYPGAQEWRIERLDRVTVHSEERDVGIILLQWIGAAGEPVSVASVAVTYFDPTTRYLWPGVGSNADVLSPFMTWWALLYAMSHLARYEPSVWAKMLDRDHSPMSVPIERGLRHVRTFLPRLILQAITGSWRIR